MGAYTEVTSCRVCGNKNLEPVLSLGVQALTGVFPASKEEKVNSGPVELVRCEGTGDDICGLVQLLQTYDKQEMYGGRYGYRSGLNPSMVRHLQSKVEGIYKFVKLEPGDIVLDIGSNDATLLKAYPPGLRLIGIDPTAERFRSFYPPGSEIVPEFFTAEAFNARMGGRKAKAITSIAMFYDLDAPLEFVRQVRDILADDGVWVFEQSHVGAMIEKNSYDMVCHEHLEFYAVRQLRWMLDRMGLKIIALEFNDVNGGSVSVTAAKASSPYPELKEELARVAALEEPLGRAETYDRFRAAVLCHRDEMREFFAQAKRQRKLVLGYGASTKGNVILQYCGLSSDELPCIGEVNEEKYGCFTPGTLIPIVSEGEAKSRKPDYLMVLPWHFESFILKKEEAYRKSGGRFFFPLPRPKVC